MSVFQFRFQSPMSKRQKKTEQSVQIRSETKIMQY